ncbi:MAG: putative metallophosphoesterase [Phycisphaerales bacterium]|nr:putative metallophosphoesterase [Phycisphaerales bacterium]
MKYYYALWSSLVVAALIAVAELAAAPVHAAGRGQDFLGYFLGAAHLLNLPGFTAAALSGLIPGHQWAGKGLALAVTVSGVFWGVVVAIVIRIGRKFRRPVLPSAEPVRSEAMLSRRRLMLGGGRAVAAAGMGVGAWSFFGEARWFEITRRQIAIKGLSPGLNGLRIVQLSDIHHGPWMSLAWVRQIIEATNALAPDIIALTGDYIYNGTDYVRPMALELAKLRPRVGVVGVMGNHDWWGGGELTKWAFAKERLPLIDNARMFVTPQRRLAKEAKDGLCLAGVGDLWEDKCVYDKALGDVPGGMPRILLSHNPDVAEEPQFLQSGLRVDLMLSGHTHGGQICLPGVGAPVTNSAYGQKYAKGLVAGPVCPVFISRGLGMTVMPVRVGVRPEIAVIELMAG